MASSDDLRALLEELASPEETERSGNQETYDLARGRQLQGDEREVYAAALGKRIAQGDARAALTAADLGLTSTLPAFQSVAQTPGWEGLSLRRAMALLGAGESVVPLLIKDLADPGTMHRFGAVVALGDAGKKSTAATEALIGALGDSDTKVRAQAFKSLLRVLDIERYGRTEAGDDVELRSPLQRLDLLLGAKLTALREPARVELSEIAHAVLAGKTPESLGLVYRESVPRDVMLRLGRSLFTSLDMPLDEIEPLTGADRKYAEALIAKSLDRQLDRAPAALARLGATWTVPALREAAAPLPKDDPFHVAAEAAIATLTRN